MLDWSLCCSGLRLLSNAQIITLIWWYEEYLTWGINTTHFSSLKCIAPQQLMPDTRNIVIQILKNYVNDSNYRRRIIMKHEGILQLNKCIEYCVLITWLIQKLLFVPESELRLIGNLNVWSEVSYLSSSGKGSGPPTPYL